MKIVEPSFEILSGTRREELQRVLQLIELAGRTCYKSEGAITATSAGPFVAKICNTFKHESVIEHSSLTVKFVCDRGVTHELVRHRLAAYSQESARYCNYAQEKFGREITVIKPFFFVDSPQAYMAWKQGCEQAEKAYFELIEMGRTPQEARSVLPNSLKTEIVMTANWREWRHIFALRCSDKAHPQIREIMIPLRKHMATVLPEIFSET